MNRPDGTETARMGRGAETACYAAGFFALGLVPMQAVAVPLWALELGASPGEVGLAVGLRSLGPLLLAIHGGALMDRLGPKAMMPRMAAICVGLCLAFPLMPTIWALMVLQTAFGLAQGLAWIGAQTLVGQWTRGDPTVAGRVSAAAILGTFAGPIAVGLAWDMAGASGAFGMMAVWSGGLLGAAVMLPRRPGPRPLQSCPLRLRQLVPNPADYRAAFALLAAPVIAALMIGSFARLGVISIQGSFYAVYLDGIGFGAGLIGILIGGSSLIGAPAALLAGPMDRALPRIWTLIPLTAVGIAAMTITPFFDGLAALAALAVLFGVCIGITQAQVLSMLGRHAPRDSQGLGVGLRTTFNRAGAFAAPVALGALAEVFGLTAGFLIAGGLLLAITAGMAILAWKAGL